VLSSQECDEVQVLHLSMFVLSSCTKCNLFVKVVFELQSLIFISLLCFFPDVRSINSIALCSGDHTVKIICCRTGQCLKVLSGHRRTPWVVSMIHMLECGSFCTCRHICLLLTMKNSFQCENSGLINKLPCQVPYAL